ncbi:hypothetical protein [Tautonia rosea]|uniref:hypothetical protein n=1 Tax=Tautonia rosea TaxID=2728037 RepID=UPI001473CB56|nr:hypothetical protein [Tautonia rosea]
MEESHLWSPCRFRDDGFSDIPNVHDHFVYALAVHLERHRLVLHTQYRDGSGPYPLIDIRFVGLVAHHFDNVAEPSILLDIQEDTPGGVIEQWAERFDRLKNHGWPAVDYVDRSELARKLASRGVRGYRVMGSCGVDGFVLATGVEYRLRREAAEPG